MAEKRKRPGPEVRKNEIIEAAVDVFGRKGYYSGTTKEIADRLDITERMIFFYFGSKKELFREVIFTAARDLALAIGRGKPPTDDIRTLMKMTARNYVMFLKENPQKMKLLFQSIDLLGDESLRVDLKTVLEGFYNYVAFFLRAAEHQGSIVEGVDLHSAALIILSHLFITTYAEFLDLYWFDVTGGDAFTAGDHFIDVITKRHR